MQPIVVRYNGGAQAAHNVTTDDGRHHTFSQFGSGTFAGARTHLSRFMLVNPIFMNAEAMRLEAVGVRDPYTLVTVERGALVTTPYHVSINRLREMSRDARHGSCGMGIGETMADSLAFPEDAIHVEDIEDPAKLRVKLERLRVRKIDEGLALRSAGNPFVKDATAQNNEAVMREWDILTDHHMTDLLVDRFRIWSNRATIVGPEFLHQVLQHMGRAIALLGLAYGDEGKGVSIDALVRKGSAEVLFEGAQGVLLDQDFGWQPYTTWTDCTFGNVMTLLDGFRGEVKRIGVTRAYMTRHGAGPFVTEDKTYDPLSANDHNALGPWQGTFRSGALDLVALRYAIEVVGGVDALSITHLDRIGQMARVSDDGQWTGMPSGGNTGWDAVLHRWWGTPACWAYDPPPEGWDPVLQPYAVGCGLAQIPVKRPIDLDFQAKLAEQFFKVRPRIDLFRGTKLEFAKHVAEVLGVPLGLGAFGPRPGYVEFFDPSLVRL